MLIFKGENTHNHVYFLLWKSVIKNPGYPKLVWGIFFLASVFLIRTGRRRFLEEAVLRSAQWCVLKRFGSVLEAVWSVFWCVLERFGAFWSVFVASPETSRAETWQGEVFDDALTDGVSHFLKRLRGFRPCERLRLQKISLGTKKSRMRAKRARNFWVESVF